MFGNTLVLTLGATPVTLVRINQDNYSSEYLYKDSVEQYRVRIRHTKVAAKNGRPEYDRHNFECTRTTFETDTVAAYDHKVYYVIEHKPSDMDIELEVAVFNHAVATSGSFLDSLQQWES